MADAEVVDLLKQLVSLPSVNPEHTDDATIANEQRVATFLADYLQARGFAIEWDCMAPERPSVMASYGPDNPVHTLLLEAHLDTVGVSDMIIPPFEPTIKDGRLYGRGACDTKGPMAAAMTALTPSALDSLAHAGVRILFIGALGEETGNVGAERLVEEGWGADSAIILEPTELSIVYAHKGALWYDIELTGKAAHGSDPDRGVSAISAMAKVVHWLEARMVEDRRPYVGGDVGVPTLNIGRVEGGIAPNIVAYRCRLDVDRRTVPGEDPEEILSATREMLSDMRARGEICEYEVRVRKLGTPFKTATESDLVSGFRQALSHTGCAPRLEAAAWYSDAGAFSRTCKEIIVFGPGSIKQAHTVDEFIEIDELIQGRDILKRYFKALTERANPSGGAHDGA